MKTKTLSILFALVMVLSMSVGVFAQDFTETWDEDTVLTVFSDVDMLFPDLFADEDSDFLWVDGPSAFPSEFKKSDGEFISKAPIADPDDPTTAELETYEGEFTYDPCGDGLVKFSVTVDRAKWDGTDPNQTSMWKYGPEKVSYIRKIEAYVNGIKVDVKKCDPRNDKNCHQITFNSKGEGKLGGYLYVPDVLTAGSEGTDVLMTVYFSNYKTALWNMSSSSEAPNDLVDIAVVRGKLSKSKEKNNYCQDSLTAQNLPGQDFATRAKYDENTGEARLQATIRNFAQESLSGHVTPSGKAYKAKTNYVIPAEVLAYYDGGKYQRITDYTCKYTVYNNANGAPRTDYCKFGEGIALGPNAIIRFDISIDHLSTAVLKAWDGDLGVFTFRVGGMENLIGGVFEPVDFPCPPVSRMQVKDPLRPFMTFFEMDGDPAISPSGAYGVYEGGLWGLYQKCGKMAYMAVRLKNDGLNDEVINLDHTAAAINGGTPMSFAWVLSTVEPEKGNKIVLESGQDVILIARAKVTDIPSQLNSDVAMTGAINFTDYGFYITGKVYSDHNNTNCVAAPK